MSSFVIHYACTHIILCAYICTVTFSQRYYLVRSKIGANLEWAELTFSLFAIGPSCPEKAFSSVTSICPNLLCTSENPLLQWVHCPSAQCFRELGCIHQRAFKPSFRHSLKTLVLGSGKWKLDNAHGVPCNPGEIKGDIHCQYHTSNICSNFMPSHSPLNKQKNTTHNADWRRLGFFLHLYF